MPGYYLCCAKCAEDLVCEKNEVNVVVDDNFYHTGDLYRCPSCNLRIVSTNSAPLMEGMVEGPWDVQMGVKNDDPNILYHIHHSRESHTDSELVMVGQDEIGMRALRVFGWDGPGKLITNRYQVKLEAVPNVQGEPVVTVDLPPTYAENPFLMGKTSIFLTMEIMSYFMGLSIVFGPNDPVGIVRA